MRLGRRQMQARLRDDAAFAEWYVEEFMQLHLPTQYHSVSAQGKREMVANGRGWARRCGFEDAEAQAHFVTLMWKVGADFFRHPGFVEVAGRRDGAEMARADAFYAVMPELAAAAIRGADDRYWYPVENGIPLEEVA